MGTFWNRIAGAVSGWFGALKRTTGGGGYLCDSCRWDYGDACRRPERPNARTCDDYKRR